MNVDVVMDAMGGLKLQPRGIAAWSAFTAHMMEVAGTRGCTAYIPEVSDERARELMSAKALRDVKRGYWRTIRMSPEDFGYLLGYDAHLVDITMPAWRRYKTAKQIAKYLGLEDK